MRRTVFLLVIVVLLGAAVFGGGRFVAAQNPGPANHPAVGSWVVHRQPEISNYPTELMILSADGTVLDYGAYQSTGVGVWEPMGASTATVTFTLVTDGPAYIVIRASIAIASGGQSYTGTFTTEAVFDPAHGGTSGQIGPGKVAGTRMKAEAPGTPVSSFAEFLPPATPAAATPAS